MKYFIMEYNENIWKLLATWKYENSHISSLTIVSLLKTIQFDRFRRDLSSCIKCYLKEQVINEIFIRKDDFLHEWQNEK